LAGLVVMPREIPCTAKFGTHWQQCTWVCHCKIPARNCAKSVFVKPITLAYSAVLPPSEERRWEGRERRKQEGREGGEGDYFAISTMRVLFVHMLSTLSVQVCLLVNLNIT